MSVADLKVVDLDHLAGTSDKVSRLYRTLAFLETPTSLMFNCWHNDHPRELAP